MPLDLVRTLSDLIAIPSVNPMGRPLSGPEFFEYRVTEYLEKLFRELGLPSQRQAIDTKRDNIVARLEGDRPVKDGGALLMFEAHQDTVPVDGMIIPPWTPTVKDGKIYGRGSCDIKGGMSAMLVALSRLAAERPRGMPTVIMACTVNEEHGFSGAADLQRLWETKGTSIIERKPDAAVIAEPTDLNVVIAHKGSCRWKCSTRGRAAHSSKPHLGENAVYKMARVLRAFEDYARDAATLVPAHRLCGNATLSVGTIQGGISVNTVPDVCTIEIDRRVLPGEDARQVYRDVVEYVRRHPQVTFEVDHAEPFLVGPSLSDDNNGPLAERLAGVVRGLYGQCETVGVPYGTDASKIAAAGIPSVVFGPGSLDQAHTCDEWLSLAELTKASEAYYQFVKTYPG